MKRLLPPLNSLKAFESAARNQSFTLAAADLNVTQGAISKQIRILEDFLKKELFDRLPHSIKLTDEGKSLFKTINKSFNDIEKKIINIIDDPNAKQTLNINAMPTIGTYWLLPHLEEFTQKHPDISVDLKISYETMLHSDSFTADIALKGSNTKIAGDLKKVKFMDEKLLLICSKENFDANPIKKVSDIKKHQVLEHSLRLDLWPSFFNENQLHGFKYSNDVFLEHFFMMIEAVEKNMGLALVPDFLVREHIKQNKFVNPLGLTYNSNLEYCLIYSKKHEDKSKIKSFTDWITSIN